MSQSAFSWPVSSEGYAWMIGVHADEPAPMPLLVDQAVLKGSDARRAQRYQPLADATTLFLDFADMNSSFSDIATFVRRYGALGGDARADFVTHWKGKKVRLPGESVATWIERAAEMRQAIELWAISKGRVTQGMRLSEDGADGSLYLDLPSHCTNEGNLDVIDPIGELVGLMSSGGETAAINFWRRQIARDIEIPITVPNRLLITATDHHPERRRSIEKSDVGAAAGILVAEMINAGLKGRSVAKIQPGGMDQPGQFEFGITPRSLLGAMWLQFATAAHENRSYERCSSCESWFEVAPGLGRPDKSYCSTACRMRAYRRRKAEAGNIAYA